MLWYVDWVFVNGVDFLGKAKLIHYLKQEVKQKYIMELRIFEVNDPRYKDGVKYALLFVDPKTGKRVLMDNHHPKGPHFHLDKNQFDYDYKNESKLIEDFNDLVFQHFGEKI